VEAGLARQQRAARGGLRRRLRRDQLHYYGNTRQKHRYLSILAPPFWSFLWLMSFAGRLQLHRVPPTNMQTQIGCTMAQTSNNEMVGARLRSPASAAAAAVAAAAPPPADAQRRSSKPSLRAEARSTLGWWWAWCYGQCKVTPQFQLIIAIFSGHPLIFVLKCRICLVAPSPAHHSLLPC
jgi:hypothetical protein